ncbi:MAG TPA: peptidyl-prolyl cis-trans isomerase [Thiotrichaceae bacterium]|nr:peptidyl-prolyl cis-trans isomerase [Thiotrichaceae bacterium]
MSKVFLILLALSLAACGGGESNPEVAVAEVEGKTKIVIKEAVKDSAKEQSSREEIADKNLHVKIETTQGDIIIELDAKNAPVSTKNFISYVESGYYDGTIFHRVIPNFMIQGGGFDINLMQKETKESIQNEADNGLKNTRGTISMARTNEPHSASAQFFINIKDNPFLDHRSKDMRGWGYAVFGKVVSGMDVVDRIEAVQTAVKVMGGAPHENVPVDLVIMNKVTLVK